MTDDKAELMISDMEDEEELSTGAKKVGGTKLKSRHSHAVVANICFWVPKI